MKKIVNKNPSRKIDVSIVERSPQVVDVKTGHETIDKLSLIEELRALSIQDFKQVIKAAKALRRADRIAEKAIEGVDD